MSRFKVYDPSDKEPPTTYLDLVDLGGSSFLVAVDPSTGKVAPGGYLLEITPDGRVRRIGCVRSELGFQLDSVGRIVFAE